MSQSPSKMPVRRALIFKFSQIMLALTALSILLAVTVGLWSFFFPAENGFNLDAPPTPLRSTPTPLPTATLDPRKPLIGVVAGHSGFDPGAVCPDGLTEASLNATVAREVADLLNRRGVQAQLLDEFDPRLAGLQADALISIHADSCNTPGVTGYKVARVTNSAIPIAEDELVDCIRAEYAAATGLPEHRASITDGMTNYHAFREIDSLTPGAIIETGFMLEDRDLLENRPKIVARGIAAGILCFLE